MSDEHHMRHALRLAARGLGQTAPNPSVGCVLVREGRIVGRGWTQPGGRPHAETVALAQAGTAARGATAYVTLEPCAHHGQTGPCAEALIEAGIARAVIACTDPDPRVSGRGIARLAAAGIAVSAGICEAEARAHHAGFLSRMKEGRPFVSLKLATSLDGYVATGSGESQWITGEAARRHAHLLRAQHDAILTGIGTVLADDPQLDCRLEGLAAASPHRIVMDRELRTPPQAKLLQGARTPPLILTSRRASAEREEALRAAGAEIVRLEDDSPGAALRALAGRGLTRLLIESGPTLSSAFYHAGLADRLYWYRAPLAIGGGGLPALQGMGDVLAALTRWRRTQLRPLGADLLEIYQKE